MILEHNAWGNRQNLQVKMHFLPDLFDHVRQCLWTPNLETSPRCPASDPKRPYERSSASQCGTNAATRSATC